MALSIKNDTAAPDLVESILEISRRCRLRVSRSGRDLPRGAQRGGRARLPARRPRLGDRRGRRAGARPCRKDRRGACLGV